MGFLQWLSRLKSFNSAFQNSSHLENGTELAVFTPPLHRSEQINENINNGRHVSSLKMKISLTFLAAFVPFARKQLKDHISISTNSGIAPSVITFVTSNAYED